ncbi:MAG: NAD(P)-dependent oxidoreductase [Owenweeksia sp.]
MSLLILGSTGGTGKLLVREAIHNGYNVRTIARQPEKLPLENKNLTVFEGNPSDPRLLASALEGCQTVISALNISRKSLNPWSSLITPPEFMSQTMQRVIRIGSEKQLKRIVVISAWGVNESFKELPFWFRAMVKWSNIGPAYRDHGRQENILRSSGLEWTAVRASGLTDSEAPKEVQVSIKGKPKPSLTISRHNVARFIIDEIRNREYLNKAVTISES